jgi:GNAT superfamily N-acetyltransferase
VRSDSTGDPIEAIRASEAASVPGELRCAYLASLPQPQEFYIEGRVARGQSLLLHDGDDPFGYAVVDGGTIVEFYAAGANLRRSGLGLQRVVDQVAASTALVKTFDTRMLAAVLALPGRAATVGHLFRGFRSDRPPGVPGLNARLAEEGDIDAILRIHDGFFDSVDEIRGYLGEGGLLLCSSNRGEVLGCGIFRRVIPGLLDADVGMVVAPAQRRKGIGAAIAATTGAWCHRAGLRPIAGCGADNEASRRALRRGGFVETDALIEITFESGSPARGPVVDQRSFDRTRDRPDVAPVLPSSSHGVRQGTGWRRATAADDEAIAAMCLALNREDPGPKPVTVDQVRRTLVELRSQPSRGLAVVLGPEGAPIGYALLIGSWSNEMGGVVCTIDELWVAPEARGQGRAKSLIGSIITGHGPWPDAPVAIDLEVNPGNQRSRALYEALGFNPSTNAMLRWRPGGS